MTTLGIIQVDRNPSHDTSMASRTLAGKPLIEWVARRVSESQRLDTVIVALGDDVANRRLARLIPANVPVFWGHPTDTLRRFVDAVNHYGAEGIVRVCADNPFIDPVLIDRLVTSAEDGSRCQYATYSSRNGTPAIFSPLGILVEWFTADSLRRADREVSSSHDRTRLTRYLYSNPDKFTLRLVQLPIELDRGDLRLTVTTLEDWERMQDIYEALGQDQLEWQRIVDYLEFQPELRRRMALLNRQNTSI